MTVEECMKRTPHRHYLAWMAWYEREWNKPDRSDHYLMQIAQYIARGKELPKITFTFDRAKPVAEADKAAIAEAVWRARLRGFNIKVEAGDGLQPGEMQGEAR